MKIRVVNDFELNVPEGHYGSYNKLSGKIHLKKRLPNLPSVWGDWLRYQAAFVFGKRDGIYCMYYGDNITKLLLRGYWEYFKYLIRSNLR